MSGWISIHRKIQEHWLWEDEPFDKRSAWIDLLLLVNHTERKVLFDNEFKVIKRGQRIISMQQLQERWSWSNTKVRNFLKLLEKDKMITLEIAPRKYTLITIENYNDYQDMKSEKYHESTTKAPEEHHESTTKAPEEHHESTTEAPQKHINNNDNKDNNDNKASDPLQKIEDYYLNQVIKRATPGGTDLQSMFEVYDKYQDEDFIINVMKETTKQNIERNGECTIKSFNYFVPILKEKLEGKEAESNGIGKQNPRKTYKATEEDGKRAGVTML